VKWHYKFIKTKKFHEGDWAIFFYSWYKALKGKLRIRWMGPYEIDTVYNNGAIKIRTIDDDKTTLTVNGHRLRLYKKPLSKEEFIKEIVHHSQLDLFT